MQVVCSDAHLAHCPTHEVQGGRSIALHEVPVRAETIRHALRDAGGFVERAPTDHGLAPIEAVHDPDLVAYLAHAWQDWAAACADDEQRAEAIADTYRHAALREGMGPAHPPQSGLGRLGYWCFDTATPMVEGTYGAARSAVDIALTATDLVLSGGHRNAYALCRPPGHHAPRAGIGGYCFFNNAAIAAQHAITAGAARVTVLDVDYHHGNGTQQIFYGRGDVQYVSLHADPDRAYPYFTGFADETGADAGRGATVNVPLPAHCTDDRYLAALDQALDDVLTFDPDLLVVSLGLDTYHGDPIGDFSVTTPGLARCGERVGGAQLPTVVVHEGGYDVATLGANAVAWLSGLLRTTRDG